MIWMWIIGGVVLTVAAAICAAVKSLNKCLEIDISEDDEAEEGYELEDDE